MRWSVSLFVLLCCGVVLAAPPKQKTAYEIMPSLVGSAMCIRDSNYQLIHIRGNKDRVGVFLTLVDAICDNRRNLFNGAFNGGGVGSTESHPLSNGSDKSFKRLTRYGI